MRANYRLVILLCLSTLLVSGALVAQQKVQKRYTYKRGDYNGIGKWYMNREIAHVMGYQGIKWLERPERETEENVTTLISNIAIQTTDIIADIGAGSGYHVFKIAPLVDSGKVYAVDIQPEMLEAIKSNKNYSQFDNIITVLGAEKSINLPDNSVDKILMVDVYHEFSFPYEIVMSMKKALKPNGKIFLIEYRGEDATVPIKKIHKMTEGQAIKEMKAAGFELEQNIGNLPWQHCMIFSKEKS